MLVSVYTAFGPRAETLGGVATGFRNFRLHYFFPVTGFKICEASPA